MSNLKHLDLPPNHNHTSRLPTQLGSSLKCWWPKAVLTCIFLILSSAIVGLGLLSLVFLLPADKIDDNVRKSAPIIAAEGQAPVLTSLATSRLDSFTDSIMLLEASNRGGGAPIVNAMNACRGTIDGCVPQDTIVKHYLENTAFDGQSPYQRYWHGYLVFLKPLLLLFDYGAIRIVNGIAQLLLTLTVCYLLHTIGQRTVAVTYFLAYLMLMPLALAYSVGIALMLVTPPR